MAETPEQQPTLPDPPWLDDGAPRFGAPEAVWLHLCDARGSDGVIRLLEDRQALRQALIDTWRERMTHRVAGEHTTETHTPLPGTLRVGELCTAATQLRIGIHTVLDGVKLTPSYADRVRGRVAAADEAASALEVAMERLWKELTHAVIDRQERDNEMHQSTEGPS